jgi:hypothetical protein
MPRRQNPLQSEMVLGTLDMLIRAIGRILNPAEGSSR